ncbi:TFIIS helical bundle-like domain family protein [Brugia pahangi]
MQQQHPAAASNSGLSVAVPTVEPTTVTVVDRLKHQLLQAYDNGDTKQATDVIIKLEKSNLTKELLEMTRIGAVVNDIRKKVAQSAPELSKRCRTLIKCWQKLAEPKPTSSGSSSANGTPSYASPAVKKGLTPGTSAKGPRVISGGSSRLTPAEKSRLTALPSSVPTPSESSGSWNTDASPTVSNGRTVPPYQRSEQKMSANIVANTIRKSHAISADLTIKAVENSLLSDGRVIRNGKRKGGDIATSDIGTTNGLSATKRLHYTSASVSPTAPHQSLLAARRADVKSTSELVAQLTENLPGYLTINISQNNHCLTGGEHGDNEGQANMDTGHISRTPILFIQTEVSKKKEKRGRSKKNKEKEGRIKDQFVANEKVIAVDNEKASTSAMGNAESVPIFSVANSVPSTDKMIVPTRNGKYDWYAMLPSLETLRNREHFRSKPSSNQRKSYIVNVLGREVLALPYIDVGLPDFLEYQYPKPERFYAEENFMYGASRPN